MRHPSRWIGAVARLAQTPTPGVPLCLWVICVLAWPSLAGGADPFADESSSGNWTADVVPGPDLATFDSPQPTLAVRPGETPKAVLTKIDIGQAALFRTTGSVYDAFAWRVRPAEAEAAFLKLRTEDGEPVALCFYDKPYTVSLGCATVEMIEGLPKLALDVDSIHLGGNGPGPDPPPPPPPPPVEKLCVLLVYESDDVDDKYPWLPNIIASQKLRTYKPELVDWIPTDKDEKDERHRPSPNAKLWTKYSQGQGWKLPHLLFIDHDKDDNLVHHADCPQDADKTLAVIRRFVP